MDKYYIARNYRSKFDAAGKAKMDCETILEKNGWKNIGFKQSWISIAVLGTLISAIGISWALIKLKPKSTLCLQYPLNKFYDYILTIALFKQCKIITIVHDVYTLKGKVTKQKKELGNLSKSNTLIVHNSTMKEWFLDQNINTNLIELNIFDYLHSISYNIKKQPLNSSNYRIVFAGNMGGKKSFIYQLDTTKKGNYSIDLYGIGFDKEQVIDANNTMLNYKGVFPSNEVIDHIDGDFGLVWYGNSLQSCDGQSGQYLKYNNPHKVSLYIQCEMPIIIWNKAGMAAFVEENKIGLTISSLEELSDKIAKITPDDYNMMKSNILSLKEKISSGYFLNTALQQAV
ncbi:hypothetical protein [Plebeiibacterium sediminum]|uniref:Beta-1,6-galactofuranosyltransferase n=1 Tax=Plebeiibacterium sediminum TaxID=2992112 RepID=A0AAE3M133_9BACT|nr:hypothetical protein [Plebeiobacterium sediminum]MCW3785153.1 hypothetical protein [Plebeiobacterium sediminum]